MCTHACLVKKKKKKKKFYEWTLIPAPPPRDKPGLHLVDTLFRSRIKVDFTEAWRGIQRGSRTERKCVMMSVVTGAAFGQFRLLAFFFFHAS